MSKHAVAKILSVVVAGVGLTVIIGWIGNIQVLKGLFPGFPTMKFVTAICFYLSGVSLFFLIEAREGNWNAAKIVLPVSTGILTLLVLAFVVTTALGVHSEVEKWLLRDLPGVVQTKIAGRPSSGTMLGFVLIATACIVALANRPTSKAVIPWLGAVIAAIGGLALIGYAADIPNLYYAFEGIGIAMAIHTAAMFVLCGIVLLLSGEPKKR